MNAILLRLITKAFSTNNDVSEHGKVISLAEAEKEFFKINDLVFSSIIKMHIDGREPEVSDDGCIYTEDIKQFYSYEIQLYASLVYYYGEMCKTPDVESNKAESLLECGIDVKKRLKKFLRSRYETFKMSKYNFHFNYDYIGKNVLEKIRNDVEKQLKAEMEKEKNEELQNKLGNSTVTDHELQLRVVANLIKCFYEYSRDERAKFFNIYSGIEMEKTDADFYEMEKKILENGSIKVSGFSIPTKVAIEMKKAKLVDVVGNWHDSPVE